jgi:large subunit ribosomal protein L35
MAYKIKPNKSVLKRFKATKTGKLKRGHSKTSHLMSGRSPGKKRELRRPEMLYEPLAKNMRKLMGLSHLSPARSAHNRALRARKTAAVLAAATK